MICWTDIESTGLDTSGYMLEVGIILTDDDLNEIDREDWVIHFDRENYGGVIDQIVLDMHEKSGLWDRCKESHYTTRAVEQDIIEWLKAHDVEFFKVPMGGSTLHFDRKWLEAHMPELEKFLHYRNVDVSSTREQVRRWAPLLVGGLPCSRELHTTLSDLEDSLELMRYFVTNLYSKAQWYATFC